MPGRSIGYNFQFENGTSWNYILNFDQNNNYLPETNRPIKGWTRLEFHQCGHCPLKPANGEQCPVARNLDQVVEDSKNTLSCTKATVTVTTPERVFSKKCATQEGLRSLFGVIMASSGCPKLDWLRPLARFHLPFADADENLFRVLSLQLLRQFFTGGGGSTAHSGEAIKRLYEDVQQVNQSFIKRIRSYCDADADKNAVAALDAYAQLFQYQKEGEYSALKRFFGEPQTSR